MTDIRCGTGFDAHAFAEDRPLILGGVKIDHRRGLAGHSDADVLIHAVIDALLGAAGLGDIGRHFPDTEEAYAGISSLVLLETTRGKIGEQGWHISNVDGTIIAQEPKLAGYLEAMTANLAAGLRIDRSRVNIKATTTEHLGFTGREEGIAAAAAAVLYR